MKRLPGKFRLISALACLMAAVFALDAVSINHVSADNQTKEVVEFDLEECTAFAQRQRKRESRFRLKGPIYLPSKILTSRFLYQVRLCFFRPSTERDQLNGIGGYLRT